LSAASKFKNFGVFEYAIIACGGVYALLSTNPILTIVAVLFPLILIKLLWKTAEAPFLYFALVTQTLAVIAKVFYSDIMHVDFVEVHDYPVHITSAFYLSVIGLIALSFGIYLVIKGFNLRNADYKLLSRQYNNRKLRNIYLASVFIYPILLKLSFSLGGLQQPLYAIIQFKWAIFLIFMINCFATGNSKTFITIFAFEIILSFTGYFSAFKDYFLIFFIGMLIVTRNNIKLGYIISILILMVVGSYMLIMWEHIKPEYRNFLSGGEAAQINTHSTSESLNKLLELVKETDAKGFADGVERTVNRVSYIDFLSAAESQVPANVAHTNGELWFGAFARVLQPRLFFPNKKAIDDSEKARLYTGHNYAGADRGTSVSLGYVAESYVDFGQVGMEIALLAFGLLIGWIYKYVMVTSPNILVGSALVIPLYFEIFAYEKALDKIVGGLFIYLVIIFVVKKFLLKPFLKYITLPHENYTSNRIL